MDYWDHVHYAIELTRKLGMYVMVLPARGSAVAGSHGGLVSAPVCAYWLNPRSGHWHVNDTETPEPRMFAASGIAAGLRAATGQFKPPGGASDGNDWALMLSAREGM